MFNESRSDLKEYSCYRDLLSCIHVRISGMMAMESGRAAVHLARKRNTEILDNTKRLTTKAGGGGDDTALKPPRSMQRNEFPQVGGKFGSPAAQDEAPKRQGSAVKMDEQSRAQLQQEELSEIRDAMKTAYEQYVGHIAENDYKPKRIVLVGEIKFYANKLIGHLQRKWKKEQLQRVVKDIVNEVKTEADEAWNPLQKCNKDEKEQPGDISTEFEQLTSCLNEMKRQKQILMEKAEKLENASNIILNAPNERKYERKNDTKRKEEEKDEKRKLSQQLQDIIQQLHTKAKMNEQDQIDIIHELEQCEKEMDDFTETFNVSLQNNISSGLQKRIHLLRVKLDSHKKELKTSISKMRVNANKEIEDEVSLIKTRITKMWKSITNESMTGHDSKQQSHFEQVEMLDSIESSFFNLKQQNNRYEKERGRISNELKELTKDIDDLTKKRHVESEEAIDDEIQKEIRQIRSKLDRQKHDFSERWKTDRIQVISVTGPVLQEISRLMTNEPFNFSVPKHFDSDKVVKGISPVLHPVVTDISWINQCLKENCKSFQQKFVRTKAYAELKENEMSLLCEIKDLKKEKDVLLNRLSKVAGANLTDNNPNIADLSDPNRATKLAEQFSELYDNPWTDAFEVLETPDERRRIDFLLDIIVVRCLKIM
ncbi:reticulocyte-binding protein homolog 2a-like isoform X2 [Mercenaria mercenaria]|uniref:reticulocyte-binding protein homolog 2a-like isoform X2 n=1 Tax=Mercenaria mercenaria TaxID=6596 RepID=UPI00234E9939|nr:reticulocyte-binding protein homolog 2a-like isoform X2 [Mercenaria mercenaria]